MSRTVRRAQRHPWNKEATKVRLMWQRRMRRLAAEDVRQGREARTSRKTQGWMTW